MSCASTVSGKRGVTLPGESTWGERRTSASACWRPESWFRIAPGVPCDALALQIGLGEMRIETLAEVVGHVRVQENGGQLMGKDLKDLALPHREGTRIGKGQHHHSKPVTLALEREPGERKIRCL